MNEADRVLRPLPSRLPPIDGESLPSYFDRLAAHSSLSVPLITILYRTGLVDSELNSALRHGYGITLPEARLEDAAVVLRLPPGRIRAMLLSHYDGVAFDLSTLNMEVPSSLTSLSLREWVYLIGSHYCSACLAEDQAWRLTWKLPFTFACERHQALLNDTCPHCARRAGGSSTGSKPHKPSKRRQPGYCMNSPAPGTVRKGRKYMNCGQNLGEVPQQDLQDSPRLLAAQRRINRVLETGQDQESGLPALDFFRALRSLCGLLLSVAQPQELGTLPGVVEHAFQQHAQERDQRREQGRRQRAREGSKRIRKIHVYGPTLTQVALMAALLPKATEMLRPRAPGEQVLLELSAQFQPFIQRLRGGNRGDLHNVARGCGFKGLVLQAWNAGLSSVPAFDHRLALPSPYGCPEGRYLFGAQHVPQLLWENEYRKHFRPFFSRSTLHDDTCRQVCSAALISLAGETTWAGAFRMLDLPFTSTGLGTAMGMMNALQHNQNFVLALHDLAARLEALPVKANYQARRTALDRLTKISLNQWKVLTGQTSSQSWWRQGRGRNVAVWLWAHVTGGDWRLAPVLRETKSSISRNSYMKFVKQDLAILSPLLSVGAARMAADIDVACPELRLEFPQDD